jgi:hypothetical protein
VLVYKDGDVKRQIVTLKELRGEQTKTEGGFFLSLVCIEWSFEMLQMLTIFRRC